MKIALVISSLGPGGAERVMSILANAWAERGTEVTLITLGDAGGDFYRVDPRVRRVGLGVASHSSNALAGAVRNIRRILALRAALKSEKPDVVVSFMTATNVLCVLACRALRIPCIVSERTLPPNSEIRDLWALGFGYAYAHAQAIVAQTQRAADWLKDRFPHVPVRVIPNPVSVTDPGVGVEKVAQALEPLAGRPFIAGMGRLSPEKGFDLLLRAFAEVSATHPEWCVVLVGEGGQRGSLEELAGALGLTGRVFFPGNSAHPHAILRRASAFVLSSRFEGMPMGLLEAMACGLACVSYDCPNGPRELITDGVNGLLAPPADIPALAQRMARLMDDSALARRLGAEAGKVARTYASESILTRWDATITEFVASGRTRTA